MRTELRIIAGLESPFEWYEVLVGGSRPVKSASESVSEYRARVGRLVLEAAVDRLAAKFEELEYPARDVEQVCRVVGPLEPYEPDECEGWAPRTNSALD